MPSDTQAMLRDAVRGFLAREVPFDRVREAERAGRADARLWKSLCDHGWLGAALPEALGGGGGGLVDAGILVEEVARRAALVPVAEVLCAVLTLVRRGEPGRAAEIARAALAGERLPVPALLEADDRFGTVALAVDAGGRLRGEKLFVDYAADATDHLVAARDARSGEVGLHRVEAEAPGVSCAPLVNVGRTPQCCVRYDGAAGERLTGPDGVAHLIRLGRALASVQIVGCMRSALDLTVRYASLREQFGVKIGTFQAVKHHCANMAIRLASARFLAYEALDALSRDAASDAQIALAKASASRSVTEVTMLAHQIHGGNGVIEENDLYFFTLRGKERALAWGSAEECLARVAEDVGTPGEWIA